MTLDDPIPISSLNQYAYCPRRCYLIHAEGEFEDNVHTLRGTHEHERVDRQRHEVSAGVRVEYALPVWSRRLGLSGRCDAVEFHLDGTVYPSSTSTVSGAAGSTMICSSRRRRFALRRCSSER